MQLPLYQIDAFSSKIFSGNPAAICPLERWLEDSRLQAIAEENNLSETAFFVVQGSGYGLRWFTPLREVDLCGHATLAAAHVLFSERMYTQPEIVFLTRSGELKVRNTGTLLTMDFPALKFKACEPPDALVKGLGKLPQEVYRGDDYFAVFNDQQDITSIEPDHAYLKELDARGVGITARGENADFVSRYFAPKYGVDEDPVTGSLHCLLTPFWTQRLQKGQLSAQQLSRRGGELVCECVNDRVLLSGQCATYMKAKIYL
jgi:PhzF family phenazine biosynthesis protein